MGCTSSKGIDDSLQPIDLKIQAQSDSAQNLLDGKGVSSDALKKKISELYTNYCIKRKNILPLICQRQGLNLLIEIERNSLMEVLTVKESLTEERKSLLELLLKKDVEAINQAIHPSPSDDINNLRMNLISIITCRDSSHLQNISKIYQINYSQDIITGITSSFNSLFGNLFSSSIPPNGVNKLIEFRLNTQPTRDALIIKDATDSLTLNDKLLLEVLCTRTNSELFQAIQEYRKITSRDLKEVLERRCTYKNYRAFILALLQCKRDESGLYLDEFQARSYSTELFNAGAARSLGADSETFIRILTPLGHEQLSSLLDAYPPNKQQEKRSNVYKPQQNNIVEIKEVHPLIRDIQSKFGGDFQLALTMFTTDKFELLSQLIEDAMSGFSTDKEAICRILGCLSRSECAKLKSVYNSKMGFRRTLEDALKTCLGQKNLLYYSCMLLLSSNDHTHFNSLDEEEEHLKQQHPHLPLPNIQCINPIGTDKDSREIEKEVLSEALRLQLAHTEQLNTQKLSQQGYESYLQSIKELKKKNKKAFDPEYIHLQKSNSSQNVSTSDVNPVLDFPIEYRIIDFEWDPKECKNPQETLRELIFLSSELTSIGEKINDEILANINIYGSVLKHKFETEARIRYLRLNINSLKRYIKL